MVQGKNHNTNCHPPGNWLVVEPHHNLESRTTSLILVGILPTKILSPVASTTTPLGVAAPQATVISLRLPVPPGDL